MAKSKKKSNRKTSAKPSARAKRAKVKAAKMVEVLKKTKNVKVGDKVKGNVQSTPSTNTFVHGSIIPFKATDTVLLIGEGNFSFTVALFKRQELEKLPPSNVFATVNDSEDACVRKYDDARKNIDLLRAKGVNVLFDVDATALEKCGLLKKRRFNRVVWNFPHAGKGIVNVPRNILSNQTLLLGFLRSIPPFLSPEPDPGTVLITLRNVFPYTDWKLCELAEKPPPPNPPSKVKNPAYTQLRSFVFKRSDWPGYEHKLTKGEHAHGVQKTGVGGEDRTWEFCLRRF